MHTKKLQSNKL